MVRWPELENEARKRGITLCGMAEQAGMCASALYRKRHGKNDLKLCEVQKFVEGLQLSEEQTLRIFMSGWKFGKQVTTAADDLLEVQAVK